MVKYIGTIHVGRRILMYINVLFVHISDLTMVYNNLVFQNHGKNLKHLENEEIKLTDCIVCLFLFHSSAFAVQLKYYINNKYPYLN